MRAWDQILSCMLEKALQDMPPGTELQVREQEVEDWWREFSSVGGRKGQVEILVTNDDDRWTRTFKVRLKNDPRVTTKKRVFDLEG